MHFFTIWEENETAEATVCDLCGGEIYVDESFYYINGETICECCLEDYARSVFAPFMRRGGEKE